MAHFPPYSDDQAAQLPYDAGATQLVRTSGMAIASLVCGITSLVTCCVFIPGILGLVFGFVAFGPIRRGQARGRELALVGIVTSIVGLALGSAVWVIGYLAPENTPQTAAEVSEADRQTLRSLGVLQEGESIELFYPSGYFSIKEGGVLLSDSRLVVYSEADDPQSCQLEVVQAIDFVAGEGWLDEGYFTVQLENGEDLFFSISSTESGDVKFERRLRKLVTQVRAAVGKPVPAESLSPAENDEGGD